MTTRDQILQIASAHTYLFEHYTHLSDAPHQLQSNSKHIANLERDIKGGRKRLFGLQQKTTLSRTEYIDLRDSKVRKWASTLTGRKSSFELRAEKEEQVYVSALKREVTLKAELDTYQQLLDEALADRERIQHSCETFYDVQKALDALYETVFSGSTPEFPEEDGMEEHVSLCLTQVTDLDIRIETEQGVLRRLVEAKEKMDYLVKQLDKAYRHGKDDVHGRGFAAGSRKEAALNRAISTSVQIHKLVHQAHRIQPQIQVLDEQLKVSETHMFQGNRKFCRMVKGAGEKWKAALPQLELQVRGEQQWVESLQSGFKQAQEDLEQARKELRETRGKIVVRIVAEGLNPPPEYEPP